MAPFVPNISHYNRLLSRWTFTNRNNGWIRLRTPYQRSKFPIYRPSFPFVTLLFHISVLLRDFLFGRRFLSRTSLDLLGLCYRYTKQLISAAPIRLLYTQSLNWLVQCGILNMALYSLLNILVNRQFSFSHTQDYLP